MSYSTREKLYNNMQGFIVEAEGYKMQYRNNKHGGMVDKDAGAQGVC
jgi:hypothetical protein